MTNYFPSNDFPSYVLDKYVTRSLQNLHYRHRQLDNNPDLDRHIFQVIPKPTFEIQQACLELMTVCKDVSNNESYRSPVPSRILLNQRYSTQLGRNVLNDDGTNTNRLVITFRKISRFFHTIFQIWGLCNEDIIYTLRELYYTNPEVYQWSQTVVNECVSDICCLMRCTRSSLHLISSGEGKVIGPLEFNYGNTVVNCMGIDGVSVPFQVEIIGGMNSSAMFILLVEKYSVFSRLASTGFHKNYPCIIVTGKGQPGVNTKRFLQIISRQLNLPVLGLFDGDVYGFIIMLTYVIGSLGMSYDSENLVTPGIKWLGIMPSDIARYNIPNDALQTMNAHDLALAENLVLNPGLLNSRIRRPWVEELKKMIAMKKCANLGSLSKLGINYLISDFLPKKLKDQCWK